MPVRLPFGKTTLSFGLPSSWTEKAVLMPDSSFDEIDLEAELDRQLAAPIAMNSSHAGDFSSAKVCVVVDDATRPTPVCRLFPLLFRKLKEKGLQEKNLTVLVSCGTHAPMTEESILHRLGVPSRGGMKIVNHDCFSEGALCSLGTTSSGMEVSLNRHLMEGDSLFLIGTIEPHIMAGFGGGLKNILPGCAGLKTIMDTHLMGPAEERFGNIGRFASECAVRQRIEEGALLAKKNCFLINTVLDPFNKPIGLFCGDPVEAFREGCALARRSWGIQVPFQSDVLIVSSNPMNHDLCQASKAFGSAVSAIRPGGLLIACLSVENGLGDYSVSPTDRGYEFTRDLVRKVGVEEYVLWKEREAGRKFSFYERFLSHSNGQVLRKADVYVYCPEIPEEILDSFGFFKGFNSMEKLLEEAEKNFPGAEAIISPYGGACFPYREGTEKKEGGNAGCI